LFSADALVKEENVCFHALRVENSSGKPQQGVNVALLQQSSSDCLACATFKQNVVRHNDSRYSIRLEQTVNVLHEVELFVRSRGEKVCALICQRLFGGFAFFVDDGNAGLFANGGFVST